jgi:preprotein translocase subunit SecF
VANRAAITVGLAAIGILSYITWAFRKIPQSYRYGIAAIIA